VEIVATLHDVISGTLYRMTRGQSRLEQSIQQATMDGLPWGAEEYKELYHELDLLQESLDIHPATNIMSQEISELLPYRKKS
jgi:hypothetical protein